MAPPLVINEAQATMGLAIFEEACAAVAREGAPSFASHVGPHEAGPESPETA